MIGFARAEAALKGGARVMVTLSEDAKGGGILVDRRPDPAPLGAAQAGASTGAGTGWTVRRGDGADASLGGAA